jgi:hypothetical protein
MVDYDITVTVPNQGPPGPQGPPGITDASLLDSGTLADARLSTNVPLKDAANTFTANQTLDGTNNVAPNQTAASGSSLMTRALTSKEPFFSLGSNYTLAGNFAYGNTGTSSAAAAVTGDFRIARAVSGTAASGFGRITLTQGLSFAPNLTGGGIRYGDYTLGVAVRWFWGDTSAVDRGGVVRLIVGANGGTPATADANALSVVGFGWEARNTLADGSEWRLFAHDGTNYTAGSWNAFDGFTTTLRPFYIAVISDGAGNISGFLGNGGSRALTTIAITGGPTGNGNSTNSFVDFVAVNPSTGTPSSIATGVSAAQCLVERN